jgi:hypothetical protein
MFPTQPNHVADRIRQQVVACVATELVVSVFDICARCGCPLGVGLMLPNGDVAGLRFAVHSKLVSIVMASHYPRAAENHKRAYITDEHTSQASIHHRRAES